ncbi:MAG: hypothetical protein Q7J28_08590 [Caulobacter sp.]|nr:hypothetical protein [Caulobacter sp.]
MRARLYGLGRPLALMALLVAAADAILFPIALFTDALSDDQLQRALYASAFALAVVFLRVAFDPAVQRALGREWQAAFPVRPVRFSRSGLMDPKWGGGLLPVLRLVLLGEFVIGSFLGSGRAPPPVLLAFVGFALCGLLSMSQLKDHEGSDADGADED